MLTGVALWLGWYDREVAAVVFEPVRTYIEQTDDQTLADRQSEFQSWSIFDPRAAAARLEQLPLATELATANGAREIAAETLGLSYEDRWRRLWSQYTEMKDVLERDLR